MSLGTFTSRRARHRKTSRALQPKELEIIQQLYANTSTGKIAVQLGRSPGSVYRAAHVMGLRKNPEYLASPAAKGLLNRVYSKGPIVRRFKPGRNSHPIGTVVTDGKGYQRIKVQEAEKDRPYSRKHLEAWPLLHHCVWVAMRGPIPTGHRVVFKGDRTDCGIDNLECISCQELVARNGGYRWGAEMYGVIQLERALARRIRSLSEESSEKQDVGPAQPSL